MRALGLVGAVLAVVGCGGSSSRPLGTGSGASGESPDGGNSVTLKIAIAGKGSVALAGSSMNCSLSCAEAVAPGTAVHLDAAPASGMVFSGWSGACTGASGCSLTLTQDTEVTAAFAAAPPSRVTLAVQLVGTGSGRIVSSPAGIDCPGTCAMQIASGTAVTLNSGANPGSRFDGFGGGCSGLSCASTFSANATVYASFSAAPPPDSCAGLMPTMPPAKTALLSAWDEDPTSCGYAISDGSSNVYMQNPFIQSQDIFVPLQAGYTAFSHQMVATGTFYAYAPDGSVVSKTMYGDVAVPGVRANGGIAVFNATCSSGSMASVRYLDDFGRVTRDVPLPDQPCFDWTSWTTGRPWLSVAVDAQDRLFVLNYGASSRVANTAPSGHSIARWFDSGGKALTPWFDVGVVDGSYTADPVFPLIGGGVALNSGGVWVSTVASGAATEGPAPRGFESGKLARVVLGGKAYAMEPYRYASGSVDVIAPDGKNCGTLTTQSGFVAVGRDGSIVVVPPNGRDRTTNLCPVTWYPEVLK